MNRWAVSVYRVEYTRCVRSESSSYIYIVWVEKSIYISMFQAIFFNGHDRQRTKYIYSMFFHIHNTHKNWMSICRVSAQWMAWVSKCCMWVCMWAYVHKSLVIRFTNSTFEWKKNCTLVCGGRHRSCYFIYCCCCCGLFFFLHCDVECCCCFCCCHYLFRLTYTFSRSRARLYYTSRLFFVWLSRIVFRSHFLYTFIILYI